MKYLLLVIFAFGVKGFAYSQDSTTDDKVRMKIAGLKIENVSRYIVYNVNCSGARPKLVIDGQCTVYDIKYIAWLKNGKSYLQRFDECNQSKIELMDLGLFNTIAKKIAEIEKAQILPPQFKVMHKGKVGLMDLITDHTCTSDFKIYWNNRFIEKHVDQFDLAAKYSAEKQLNVNYWKNQKNILNKLYQQINKAIIKAGYSSGSPSQL